MEAIFDDGGARRVRIERSAAGESHTTFFLDAWSEVRDGKLQRYIVHGSQRVARLSDKNGAPAATGKGSAALSAEAPGARSGTTNAQSGAPASLMHLGLGASPFFIALALLAALASFYRRQLLAFGRYASPIVGFGALLLLSSATGCGHEAPPKEPPIEDGTVQVLSDEDELLFDDQIGSLTETTSGSGASKASSATYAFGLTRYDTSSETRKFANTPRDAGVGLDQMGARSYAPELGVWTSGDPLALTDPGKLIASREVGNANAYAYAAGRGLTFVDRDGLLSAVVVLGVVCVVTFTVGMAMTMGPGPRANPVSYSYPVVTNVAQNSFARARDQIRDSTKVAAAAAAKKEALQSAKSAVRTEAAYCPPPKIVIVSSSAYPETASHIREAQASGKTSVCTVDRVGRDARRSSAISVYPTKSGKDRDEYPMAICREGGGGASVRYVTPSDNRGAGASVGAQIATVPNGCPVIIKTGP